MASWEEWKWRYDGGHFGAQQPGYLNSGGHQSSQGQGQDPFYGSYYQQPGQQYYLPFNSQIAPPPGFDNGTGRNNHHNFFNMYNSNDHNNSYQGYQQQGGSNQIQFSDNGFVPTMVYSSSTAANNNPSNGQWFGDYMTTNNTMGITSDNSKPNQETESSSQSGRQWYGEFCPSTSNSEPKFDKEVGGSTTTRGGGSGRGGGRGYRNSENKKYYNGKHNPKQYKLWQQGGIANNGQQQSQNNYANNKTKPRENWEPKVFTRKKNISDNQQQGDNALEGLDITSQLQKNNGRIQQQPLVNKSRISWRNKEGDKSGWRSKRGEENTTVCQRERLIEQLVRGTLECLVCCERVRHQDSVWSCSNCYHILHLRCVVKWASSSKDDNGWRCPACQNISKLIPTEYTCMCGKLHNPTFFRGETPHCCGQICGKKKDCPHGCTILCHPGPCPQCCANVNRSCGCGKTERIVICSSTVVINCESTCEKALNCGIHLCEEKCHQGDCKPCERKIHQVCYCGQKECDLNCDGTVVPPEFGGPAKYECGSPCPLTLSCGSHPCPQKCHAGPCPKCRLDPEVLTNCPCGRLQIPKGSRTKCIDPILLCGNICNKVLDCGPAENHHCCKSNCHEGPCPPCEGVTSVQCRCGLITKEVFCKQLTSNPDDILCSKRCTKKRACGKHKCNQVCCIDVEHICPLPCNKSLTCGQHKCERLCHKGHCSPCLAASFEELHCECGKSVILPPVPCGTRAPECTEPCSRNHPCGHAPLHNCHSFSECPPCSVLTSKYCYGAHEMRKTVPCHMGEYSCGLACGRPLSCGHKCIRKCHDGSCLAPGVSCTQPCTEQREIGCEHPCAAPCHPGKPCPTNIPCLAKVQVTCECGRRSMTRTCSENSSEYQRIATSLLASKMADVRLGKSVDTTDMSSLASKLSLKTLECNEECRLQERNLKLAIGLQIANPDLSSKLHPRYSDSMKAWAKKDTRFCEMVHEKLTNLVQLAKTSKQKSRSYSFQSMGAIKRQFVHEYCEHFGVESVAYDPEPNRNIVATAYKDKCWLPSYSLLEVIQRESGHRKVPTLLPSLKKDTPIKETTRLVSVRTKLQLQPAVLAKHEPDLNQSD